MNEIKYLTVYNTTGANEVNVVLNTIDGTIKQKFGIIHYSNTTHQINSGASGYNKCLTVESASCNDGQNVFQYQYNASGNDQWLIEPVGYYNSMYGRNYAQQNYNNHLMTYPNVSDFSPPNDNHDFYIDDGVNFVSQCLVAGGVSYRSIWWSNKKNNLYLSPINNTQLKYSWSFHNDCESVWLDGDNFGIQWRFTSGMIYNKDVELSHIINNVGTAITKDDDDNIITYGIGDVVQIYLKPDAYSRAHQLTMYITGIDGMINEKRNYRVTYRHNSQTYVNRLLKDVCQEFLDVGGQYTATFLKFNGYH